MVALIAYRAYRAKAVILWMPFLFEPAFSRVLPVCLGMWTASPAKVCAMCFPRSVPHKKIGTKTAKFWPCPFLPGHSMPQKIIPKLEGV